MPGLWHAERTGTSLPPSRPAPGVAGSVSPIRNPHLPQEPVDNDLLLVNERDANDEPVTPPQLGPPGVFVTNELAERCAAFLDQVKRTVSRRQESGLLPLQRGEEAAGGDGTGSRGQ